MKWRAHRHREKGQHYCKDARSAVVGGQSARPSAHAPLEKEHQAGTSVERQRTTEGGTAQGCILRCDIGWLGGIVVCMDHRGVFFPATARSIVLGCMFRSNFCRTCFASSRALTGSLATSCCSTKGSN